MQSVNAVLLLVSLAFLFAPGQCALILGLREPPASPVILSVPPDQARPINLVLGRTYEITCRDDAVSGENMSWRKNGIPVSAEVPSGSGSAVYSSPAPNEQTLVLREFEGGAVGVYSCHGAQQNRVTLDIEETSSLTLIAGTPERNLTTGTLPSNGVISLSTFISSSSPTPPTVTWVFNGGSEFPPGVHISGSQVLLTSPITGSMRGNYTCLAEGAGVTKSALFVVNVSAPPLLMMSPWPLEMDEAVFLGNRVNVSCADNMGFPQADILWSKDGRNIADGSITVFNEREAGAVRSTLVISSFLPSHVGTYTCSSSNFLATSSRTFTINQILTVRSYQERGLWLEGETLVLKVNFSEPIFDHSRRIQWEWHKDGVPLIGSGRTEFRIQDQNDSFSIELHLSDLTLTDFGLYQCLLYTTLGSRTLTFDPITVLGIDISSTGFPTNSSLFIGLNFDLTCVVTLRSRVPLPLDFLEGVESTWTRDGLPLASRHISVSATERVMNASVSPTLRTNVSFSPLMQGDGGRYVCSATCPLPGGAELAVNYSRTLLVDSTTFQLKLLDIGNCPNWVNDNGPAKAETVISTLVTSINQRCPSCDVTPSHVASALFVCFPASPSTVTFRAHLLGTNSTPSSDIITIVEAWLKEDGTVHIDVVLTKTDELCPIVVSSLRVEECRSEVTGEGESHEKSGVPLVVVIGVSSGVGGLLVLVLAVVITVVVVLASARSRRGLVSVEADTAEQKNKNVSLNAVNPTLTDSCYKSFDPEPQYEDVDKYDYIVKTSSEGEAYETMNSVQLIEPQISNDTGHMTSTNGHVINCHGCNQDYGQSHVTKNQSYMISNADHMINSLEYDYAAIH